MESRLFRQKSVERISSPEQLQDYMRVTSPGVWLVLAAVIALLAGLLIASALSTLETTVPVKAGVSDGQITLQLPVNQKDMIEAGTPVRIGSHDARVTSVYEDGGALGVTAQLDDPTIALPDGTYDAEVVTERITPLSLLLH